MIRSYDIIHSNLAGSVILTFHEGIIVKVYGICESVKNVMPWAYNYDIIQTKQRIWVAKIAKYVENKKWGYLWEIPL